MRHKKWLALLLVLSLLLTGCAQLDSLVTKLADARDGHLQALVEMGQESTRNQDAFSQLEYTRPDMNEYENLLDESCQLGKTSTDVDEVLDQTLELYEAYDVFYTMLNLADIHYCLDLSDAAWQREYEFCTEQSARVDEGMEDYYEALAQSPILEELEEYFGEGFFDGYAEGESMWNEEFVSLINQERSLVAEFYTQMETISGLSGYEADYYDAAEETLGPLLVQLIALRQDIAGQVGYPDYETFAWDWYYSRDFSSQDAEKYVEEIQEYLVPLYVAVQESDLYYEVYRGTYRQAQCEAYVRSAAEAMGGGIGKACQEMLDRELYDIAPGTQKYAGSFEVYLTSYQAPFVFVNPYEDLSDLHSFAHEFGHFTNDYLTGGSYVSTDVAELFSQGMEYLSLCYATEPDEKTLNLARQLKLADSLGVYVEQAAYYAFEHQAYQLTGDDLTVENLNRIYSQVARDFGFDSVGWDEAEWTLVTHYFTNPFYVISYVVSNDAAMQLYQMEREEAGSGLELYQKMVKLDEDGGFRDFLDQNGLDTPFTRVQEVAESFRTDLVDTLS